MRRSVLLSSLVGSIALWNHGSAMANDLVGQWQSVGQIPSGGEFVHTVLPHCWTRGEPTSVENCRRRGPQVAMTALLRINLDEDIRALTDPVAHHFSGIGLFLDRRLGNTEHQGLFV